MDLTATPRDGLLGMKDNEPAAPAVRGNGCDEALLLQFLRNRGDLVSGQKG